MAHNTEQLLEIGRKADEMSSQIVGRHPRMKALLPKISKTADHEPGDAKWVEMQRKAADVVKSKQNRFNTASDSLAQQAGWVKGMHMEKEVRDKVFALLAMLEMERALEMETFDSLDTMIHQYRRMVYLGKKEDDRPRSPSPSPGNHHPVTQQGAHGGSRGPAKLTGENSKRAGRHTRPSVPEAKKEPLSRRAGPPPASKRSPKSRPRSPSPSPKASSLPVTPPSPSETGETEHVQRLRRARKAKEREAAMTYKAGESPTSSDVGYRDDYGQEYWSSYVDSIATRTIPASRSEGNLSMKENGRRQPEGLPRPRSHDWIAAHFDECSVSLGGRPQAA